jgi:hypothetical protein
MREAFPFPPRCQLAHLRSLNLHLRFHIPLPNNMEYVHTFVKVNSIENRNQRRRSPIPQLTSLLAHTSKESRCSTLTSPSSSAVLQKNPSAVQSRSYPQAKRWSISSRKPIPPSSYESHGRATASIRLFTPLQSKLHIGNCSIQSLAGIDAALPSNEKRASTSLPLRAKALLRKSKTSASLAKSPQNPTTQ